MKKKLALILIIVLCVAVVFTFAACKKKTDDGNGTQTVSITEQQAEEAIAAMKVFASRWVINNSTETLDRSTDLQNALIPEAVISTAASANVPGTVRVRLDSSSGMYTVKVEWGTVKKEFTLEAKLIEWGDWAGQTPLEDATSMDVDKIFVNIYNAFVNTVNDAKAKGELFSDNGIGFSGKAYLKAGYGEGDRFEIALQVKGNIGLSDEDTAVALEVLGAEDSVIFGIYYDGQEEKEDCKLYLRREDKIIYIDHANIVSLIKGLVGSKGDAVAAALETIEDLEEIDESGTISMILGILFSEGGLVVEDGDTTTYQISLDLEELFASIQELVVSTGLDETINELISDFLPEPLNQLNLATVEGIAGQLLITVAVENDLITEAELAFNMPKRDFRFSDTDTVSKVYGPLNFVLGLTDFSIGTQTDILPDLTGAEPFSPLNFNFTGDITIYAEDQDTSEVKVNSVFSYKLLTDINPFNFGAAKGSLVITELKDGETNPVNFLTLTYDQTTGVGYLLFKDEASTVDCIDVYNYLVDNYDIWGVAKDELEKVANFIKDFILDMIESEDNGDGQGEPDGEDEEGGFDFMGLFGAFGDVQGWYEALVEDGKVIIELDKDALLRSILSIDLTVDDFNDLIEIINDLGLLDAIDALENPESVEVYFNTENTEDYENIFFVKVVVDDEEYVLVIDGTKWAEEKVVEITFSIDDVDYVLVTIKYEEDKAVKIADADSTYAVTITATIIDDPDADELEYHNLELAVIVANNEDGKYNGLQVTFSNLDEETVYTVYVEGEVSWIIDNIKGFIDFDFTAEDSPHYGFGYESNDFVLDVDINNMYFNWGGANDPTVVLDGDFADITTDVYDIFDNIMEMLGLEKVA